MPAIQPIISYFKESEPRTGKNMAAGIVPSISVIMNIL
jgi:hypothetical protein